MAGLVVKCTYEFQAETDTDLSLSVGDLVKVTKVVNDDWYEGVFNDKKGQFPKAFVEECHDVFDVGIALSSFQGEQDGDLPINEGELVVITEIIDENWMNGYTKGGKYGMFPRSFIKQLSLGGEEIQMEDPSHACLSETIEEDRSHDWVEVLNAFNAQEAGELQLEVGMFVQVVKEIDDFWCEGKTKDGQQGIFPKQFVNLPSLKTSIKADVNGKETRNDEPDFSSTNETGIGKVIADFDFSSTEPGDLNFLKGDKIILLEHVSDSWLKGRLNNTEGIFPANYVTILNSADPSLYEEIEPTKHSSQTNIEDLYAVPDKTRVKTQDVAVNMPAKKKPPGRPKPPVIKKSVDTTPPKTAISHTYQFKTKSQPTVIIQPEYLKPGNPNVIVFRKKMDNLNMTSQQIQPSFSAGMQSNNPNLKETDYTSYKKDFNNLSGDLKEKVNEGWGQNKSKLQEYKKETETKGAVLKKEFESISKNIPNEEMSTFQRMKCANSNLNSAVTIANTVGIKTTKTQLAKGAVKMGAGAYITGSASSKGNKPALLSKSTALGSKFGKK